MIRVDGDHKAGVWISKHARDVNILPEGYQGETARSETGFD